jgi:hypothetical protein
VESNSLIVLATTKKLLNCKMAATQKLLQQYTENIEVTSQASQTFLLKKILPLSYNHLSVCTTPLQPNITATQANITQANISQANITQA